MKDPTPEKIRHEFSGRCQGFPTGEPTERFAFESGPNLFAPILKNAEAIGLDTESALMLLAIMQDDEIQRLRKMLGSAMDRMGFPVIPRVPS